MADMPLGDALSLVDQCADAGVGEFLLTGGEPVLREDLPAIIDRLGQRRMGYSVNTAVLPPGPTLAAMRRNPPMFVAVSVDGPKSIHDRFRGRAGAYDEAMEAIGLYKALGADVAAGTTLTTFNFGHLRETLGLVAASGADSWGLHLAVPEGRAAARSDLMLSKSQLRALVRFVAAKRAYFPVSMADEIGYLGDYEPLCRETPLACGAGRSHCVVLPDGSVVPCTTLDVSTAAGNLRLRPLMEIWRDGFAELRRWQPDSRCRRCDYARACRGGCWLQRRHGRACAKEAWHVPAALKTAAGLLVCLGALGSPVVGQEVPAPDDVSRMPEGATVEADLTRPRRPLVSEEAARPLSLSQYILAAYCPQYPATTATTSKLDAAPAVDWDSPPEALADDPAWRLLIDWRAGKLDTPAKRAAAAGKAMDTAEPSLAVSALAWRVVSEPLLDDAGPARRSAADRKLIRETLGAVEKQTVAWREQQVAEVLTHYVSSTRPAEVPAAMRSKAQLSVALPVLLSRDTGLERWGTLDQRDERAKPEPKVVREYIERHPYAESMLLQCTLTAGNGLALASETGKRAMESDKASRWGVFDILIVPDDVDNAAVTLRPMAAEDGEVLKVKLPAGSEVTYIDVLRLACEQHKIDADHELVKAVAAVTTAGRPGATPHRFTDGYALKAFDQWPGGGLLAMPAVRKIVAQRSAAAADEPTPARNPEARTAERAANAATGDPLEWFLADFWMF
jgi:radical SAM protein with 4Fe4S-binding SPASM domain